MIHEHYPEYDEVNNVLAQVYFNKDRRNAKIGYHSDKTEDMTDKYVIVSYTIYDCDPATINGVKLGPDGRDYLYNGKNQCSHYNEI